MKMYFLELNFNKQEKKRRYNKMITRNGMVKKRRNFKQTIEHVRNVVICC